MAEGQQGRRRSTEPAETSARMSLDAIQWIGREGAP
jgi:hypothetical protein